MCQEPVKHHIIEMLAPDGPHESIGISAGQTAQEVSKLVGTRTRLSPRDVMWNSASTE